MAISSNTGDEFEYNSDKGYKNSKEAFNNIDFGAIVSMVVSDDSLLDVKSDEQSDDSGDEDSGAMKAPEQSPILGEERGFQFEAPSNDEGPYGRETTELDKEVSTMLQSSLKLSDATAEEIIISNRRLPAVLNSDFDSNKTHLINGVYVCLANKWFAGTSRRLFHGCII